MIDCELCGQPERVDCDAGMISLDISIRPYACPNLTASVRQRSWLGRWPRMTRRRITEYQLSDCAETGDRPELVAAHGKIKEEWGKQNIILSGPNGTGKTHLALAALNHAEIVDLSTIFVSERRLFSRIKASFDPESDDSEMGIIDDLCRVDVLCIDDLGMEKPSDWVAAELWDVIDGRHNARKPTIITTNLHADLFERDHRWRSMISRLLEDCILIKLEGADLRRQRGTEVHS